MSDKQRKTENSLGYRAGFVSFVGRPNVGKSSLMNALVGQKVAIISDKPQTTRRTIRGIVHTDSGQLIIVDTPGVHRPRTLLGQRLNDAVSEVVEDVDVLAFCIPANEKIGPGDRYIIENLASHNKSQKIAIVTKIDTVKPEALAAQLLAISAEFDWKEIIPVSVQDERQLDRLSSELIKLMPESEQLYPDDIVTDLSNSDFYAELIREAALALVHDELPHSIAVLIDEIIVEDSGLQKIYASLYVERDSQKPIIIGKQGSRLAEIGRKARLQIEEKTGEKCYLNLQVKVSGDWQRDPKKLERLGFNEL